MTKYLPEALQDEHQRQKKAQVDPSNTSMENKQMSQLW
jgi:hypothetical protein